MEVYEPAEDSELIKNEIKEIVTSDSRVLDVGTGSGILAIEAAKYTDNVIAIDINPNAITTAYHNSQKENCRSITFIESDQFNNEYFDKVLEGKEEKFDVIMCNPPYLPDEEKTKDVALFGGKHGYEWIVRFLNNAANYLKPDGKILLLFSSLSKPDKIYDAIDKNGLETKEIAKVHIFFEDLFVHVINKSEIRVDVEKQGISNIHYLAHGKRGTVFTGTYQNKKVTIKTKRKESEAQNRIEIEANWIRKLEIGPTYILSGNNFVVYDYIDGIFIADYIKQESKENIKKIFLELFNQTRYLDNFGVDKEEMHHPYKNLLITKDGVPILIDFERSHHVENPKNTNQLCQFLISSKLNESLNEKDIHPDKETLMNLAIEYKKDYSDESFNNILNYVKSL